jgi:hypothetical protein
MNDIDDLLAQVKAEYEQPQQLQQPQQSSKNKEISRSPLTQSSALDNLLAEVQQEIEGNTTLSQSQTQTNTSTSQSVAKLDNNLIHELKQEFKETEKIEEQRKQQQLQQQKQLQQQQEKKRRQALESKAKEWLKNLKPNSDEGMWFEEFSYAYESKLEAAIDYLQAIRETRFLG